MALAAGLGLPTETDGLDIVPTQDLYGSPYDVTGAAVASVAVAVWAAATFDAERRERMMEPVIVDAVNAAISFHSERLLRIGDMPDAQLWDAISGNYPTRDGWVRLHTNLAAHHAAVVRTLGCRDDREAVAAAVSSWRATELESAVVAAGGVATALRTRQQWRAHPQGRAVSNLPLVGLEEMGFARPSEPGLLLDGVRVLDLTRVIAGPVAGRFLASFGADVLRVDAPLDDALILEIDTGVGKRRTSLDLRDATDRHRFEALLAEADVLLSAFRPGALDTLGYGPEELAIIAGGLVCGQLSAYGEAGPWRGRRGFDSVVQVAAGIADTCGFDLETGPSALPAQALDHASGYLLAAGVLAGLVRRQRTGRGQRATVALARTADWLETLGVHRNRPPRTPVADDVTPYVVRLEGTHWGTIDHVQAIGKIGGRVARWQRPPSPRDEHEPRWERLIHPGFDGGS